jgi:hypothetical protein
MLSVPGVQYTCGLSILGLQQRVVDFVGDILYT